MALYAYKAFSSTGAKVTGTIDAPSLGMARELLQQKGMYPLTIDLATSANVTDSWWKQLFVPKVTLKEKILFTKQFAILLKSGVPMLQSLDMLADQFKGSLHRIIISLKDTVKGGESLAQGMKQYPQVFENIYVQLVRAGEASGKLELVLERLTDYLSRQEEVQKKIKDALFMPMINLAMIGIAVVGLVLFVVPTFKTMFEGQGAHLPLPTRILSGLSDALSNYYIVIAVVIVLLVVAVKAWKSTPSGSLFIDKMKLKIPLLSTFARLGAIVQFCKTLGLLIESGVNLSEALGIVAQVVDNQVLRQVLEEAREKIIKQGRISQYLKQTGIFPPLATYLIATGEESGKLDVMLTMVGDIYERDLIEFADTLTTLLNPFIMALMALVVGFIVIAIALPMFNIVSVIG